MLSELLRFELRFHVRQPSFTASCLFFFGFGFVLTGTGFGAGELHVNAPSVVMQSLGFASLFSIFALAIFGSHALLRDADSRMQEIVFTTPIGHFPYLFSRFAGSYVSAAIVLALTVAGMVAALWMPWQEPAQVTPFDVRSYLYAYAVVILPNLLFTHVVLFATAARTRSALATYVAAIFVYILYFVLAALTNSPFMAASVAGKGMSSIPALLDPFALSSFFYDTRYWTALEKDTRFVPLQGTFLLNRLLCIGGAAAIWALLHRTFSFRLLRRSSKAETSAEPRMDAPARAGFATITAPAPASPVRRWLSAWLSASRGEIRGLMRNGPTIVLLLLWIGLALTELRSEVLEVEYAAALWPSTSLIVAALATPLSIIGIIVILYFTAETFWRERQAHMASILDATPVRSSARMAAKWTAMSTLIATLVLIGIGSGVLLQWSRGYTHVQPLLYASLFYYVGLPLALLAAAAIFLHSLSRGKYLGMMLTLLAALFTQRAQLAGLDHHLWRFGTAPAVEHSDMNGFALADGFHAYMLLWGTCALLLLAIASLRWRSVRRGERNVPLLAGLTILILALGSWIFYSTTVRNPFVTPETLTEWKASYERKYRPLAATPQPEIAGIVTHVGLDPDRGGYELDGRYELVNRTSAPIPAIHVAVRRTAQDVRLTIPGADLRTSDRAFGMYAFTLARPLLPGERTALRFHFASRKKGFSDDEPDRSVVPNGSLLTSNIFPSLGYRRSYEIRDERERAKRGLPKSDPWPEEGQHGAGGTGRVSFVATISTSADQVAVTSGTLERSWSSRGRRYFRYRASQPIPNVFGITSARYATTRRQHGAVEIVLYRHPGHDANASRIMDVAAQSLDYLEANLGPLPHRQLHLVEVPGYWQFGGFAYPGMIVLNENRVMRVDDRDQERPDLLLRRVAHEVAHQWFGHQLVARNVEGGPALVESLTKYAELMILERMRGREQVRQILGTELDRYLAGRGSGSLAETPLARVTVGEPYLYYGKGAMVMYAVRELIGEEAVNRALRALMREQSPTTADLLGQLRGVSSPEHAALIEEWFEHVVLYDVRLADARVRKRSDGRFDVVLRVTAAKSHTDATGKERAVPMNEELEIAIDDSLQRKRIRSGTNEITLTVDQAPATVAVDPRLLRIDKNRFDNEKRF